MCEQIEEKLWAQRRRSHDGPRPTLAPELVHRQQSSYVDTSNLVHLVNGEAELGNGDLSMGTTTVRVTRPVSPDVESELKLENHQSGTSCECRCVR